MAGRTLVSNTECKQSKATPQGLFKLETPMCETYDMVGMLNDMSVHLTPLILYYIFLIGHVFWQHITHFVIPQGFIFVTMEKPLK